MEAKQPPKEKKQYARYKVLLGLLPKHRFDITAAARESGLFAEGYIASGSLSRTLKANEWFQWQYQRLVDENLSLAKDKAESIYALVDNLIDTGEYKGQVISPSVLCKLLDIRLKTLHAYGMDRTDESERPQDRLTKAQAAALRKDSLKLIKEIERKVS